VFTYFAILFQKFIIKILIGIDSFNSKQKVKMNSFDYMFVFTEKVMAVRHVKPIHLLNM